MYTVAQRLESTSTYWQCAPSAWNDIGLDLVDYTIGLLDHDSTMERVQLMYAVDSAGNPRAPKNLKDLDWQRCVNVIWSALLSRAGTPPR